jgi:hypothetical protein
MREIVDAAGLPVLTIGRASPGRMAVISEGSRGQLFQVCPKCGFSTTKIVSSHETHMGKPCAGRLDTVALGHVFETDVLRLWFPGMPREADYYKLLGAAFALADGAAETLEVPSNDISAAVTIAKQGMPQIVLYDNVPGGAGLVSRLEDRSVLIPAMTAAMDRVSGKCGCRPEDSCYACLRSYANQYAHSKLKRGEAWDVLSRVLNRLPN